jgi:hypothetical protein
MRKLYDLDLPRFHGLRRDVGGVTAAAQKIQFEHCGDRPAAVR